MLYQVQYVANTGHAVFIPGCCNHTTMEIARFFYALWNKFGGAGCFDITFDIT